MNYTLVGSITSPFVRRIRLLMDPIPHTLKSINIFEEKDAAFLKSISPVQQIPVLIDGNEVIWDSKVIYQYLNDKHLLFPKMTALEENRLIALERGLDAGIVVLLLSRSGFDVNEPMMYLDRQKERMDSILQYLKPWIEGDALKVWNFSTMTLYAWLDWAKFRKTLNLENYPFGVEFLKTHAHRNAVKKTEIIVP